MNRKHSSYRRKSKCLHCISKGNKGSKWRLAADKDQSLSVELYSEFLREQQNIHR